MSVIALKQYRGYDSSVGIAVSYFAGNICEVVVFVAWIFSEFVS
jgi:hypothetical protein